jgi:hypothetical protein
MSYVYLAGGVAFFALSAAFVVICERLQRSGS